MCTQCVYRFKAKTDHVAWDPKTKSRMKKAREREREAREEKREGEREREAILQLEASPNVSLKFVETPWLSYILWNNGLGRENNRFTNEQRLLR